MRHEVTGAAVPLRLLIAALGAAPEPPLPRRRRFLVPEAVRDLGRTSVVAAGAGDRPVPADGSRRRIALAAAGHRSDIVAKLVKGLINVSDCRFVKD